MDASRIDFSTDDLPEQGRDAFIRDYYGQIAMRFDLAPLGGRPIGIHAHSLLLPGLSATAASISAIDAERTCAMRSDGNSDIMITLPRQQVVLIEGGKEPIVVAPGDALATALDRPVHVVSSAPSTEALTLQISRALLAPLVRDLDDRLTGRIAAGMPALSLLGSYVDALLRTGPATPTLDRLAARHVVELVAAALAPADGSPTDPNLGGVTAARLATAKRLVEQHLHRHEFSAAFVAQRLGVSPRYVRMLFEPEGLSFGAYVTERRLALAFDALGNPRQSGRRIIDIALDLGFGDIRTFNRAFRKRFGQTPSDVRADGGRAVH